MSLDLAVRLTEILLALAFIQQGLEHLSAPGDEQRLFLPRIVLSILLLVGFQTQWVCLALVINALFILNRFQGPFRPFLGRLTQVSHTRQCLALSNQKERADRSPPSLGRFYTMQKWP